MTICQRCSDIISEAHEGPTRGVTSEPGHALQILAQDAAEWKARAMAAEAKVKELEGQLAMLERLASKVVGAIY